MYDFITKEATVKVQKYSVLSVLDRIKYIFSQLRIIIKYVTRLEKEILISPTRNKVLSPSQEATRSWLCCFVSDLLLLYKRNPD